MSPTDRSESQSDSSVASKALDLAVFAPLGLALEFRRVVPELAEAGRRQVAFSQSLGRAALRTLAKSASQGAKRPEAASVRSEGSVPNGQANTRDTPKAGAVKATPTTKVKPTTKQQASTKKQQKKTSTAGSAKKSAKKTSTKKASNRKPATKAVPGYDAMTARQVVALAAEATPAELRWMRSREQGNKKRKTVLAALER